jgi:hypothetical protein
VASLDTTLSNAPSGQAAPTGGSVIPSGGASDAPTPFIANCCGKRLSTLEPKLMALSDIVPEYTSKYRNLNLLTLGIRLAGALPERADSLRTAVRAFRAASNRAAADQALGAMKAALATFQAVADTAVQRIHHP